MKKVESPLLEQTIRIVPISRRSFIRGGAATAALLAVPVLDSWSANGKVRYGKAGPAQLTVPLDKNWEFLGKAHSVALEQGELDAAFSRITLPHCATRLSWQEWDPSTWEDIWVYRRHFTMPPEFKSLRTFLHFDRVMASAHPVLNGRKLQQHSGGFLPFDYEITSLVQKDVNTLAVAVDSRWNNIPPAGSPKGPASIDYLLPGGICGPVTLRAVPRVFISNVFAKPVNALDPTRRVEITCHVDAGIHPPSPVVLVADLRHADRTIAIASTSVKIDGAGQDVVFSLDNLKDITLWDVEKPYLYNLVVTLLIENKPIHSYQTRVGFREARFEVGGFFLNGRRLQLFGLNRHELYPYVGFAAPTRLLQRDAEIMRLRFNCNIVRCSHYPQSEAFLDACDELGLLVWEEIPGWQYIGDKSWQDLAVRDTSDMVTRDRNHPSIVIWGVRINESGNIPDLYRRTREVAQSLDGSRPTSGSMTPNSRKNWRQDWHQDVFAFDDYHSDPDGSVGIEPPTPGVPYMLAEAVGQYDYGRSEDFCRKYRRAGDPAVQVQQALLHAQVHSKAAANPQCAGVIAWCAFDYPSLMNSYAGMKCPGIADIFRLPKLGASFYLAQVDPKVRPVIEPNFYWDFGPHTPYGPGQRSAIFSNCDWLEVSINGKHHAVLRPDWAGFPNLKYPPFFVDLRMNGADKPELRIDGYVGDSPVLSRLFSADNLDDRLWLHAEDSELQADGSDATRLAFGVVDKFGAPRAFADGQIFLNIDGPGVIVGDNPFQVGRSGGIGAVWVRTMPDRTGTIRIHALHSLLGSKSVAIRARRASSEIHSSPIWCEQFEDLR